MAVCKYLTLQYPKVLFRSDSGGIYKTRTQAGIYSTLQSGRGHPDLLIIHRHSLGSFYNGLAIEFKKNEKEATNPTGRKAREHLAEQMNMLEIYSKQGFDAHIAWNFEMAKNIIDKYMHHEKERP